MQSIVLKKPGTYTYTLDKEGSELNIVGRFWLKDGERFKLNLKVVHSAPHTSSRVSLRAVVSGTAHASLNGLVIVEKNAQGTDSYLSEKVLLLSKKATASAIPNMEIKANQVKCSHAAAAGPIDEDQLFYLTSRGISPNKAKSLIAKGFLNTINL